MSEVREGGRKEGKVERRGQGELPLAFVMNAFSWHSFC